MYFGLVCLFLGAIAMVTTKTKVSRVIATGEEVKASINWSIVLFETNLIGLAGGLFLKYVVASMKVSVLAFFALALTIVVVAFVIVFVYNINETFFKTYKYFLTEVTKKFYAPLVMSTFFWITVYYFF